MPHMFDTIVKAAGAALLWGGSSQQNHQASNSNRSTADAASNGAQATGVRQVERVDVPHPKSTSERVKELRDEEKASFRKRPRASEDERRLTGDYRIPEDATAIGVPSYDDNSSEHERNRSGSKTMVGFRPVNTLNQRPHVTKAGVSRNAQSNGRLETRSSVGLNVKARKDFEWYDTRDHGITYGTERNPKRQKVGKKATRVQLTSDPVDLTDDDDNVMPGHGTVLPSPSVSKVEQRRPSDQRPGITVPPTLEYLGAEHFHNNESRTVDRLFQIPKEKRRRKSKDGSKSSHASPELFAQSVDREGVSARGSREAPVEVADDSQTAQSTAPPDSKRRRIDQSEPSVQRPDMKLMEGLPTGLKASGPRGGYGDFSGKSKKPTVERRPSVERVEQRKALEESNRTKARLEEDSAVGVHAAKGQKGRQPSPRLSSKFVRDASGPPLEQRSRASQRMLAESAPPPRKVSPIDDSLGSVDELQGSNTVASQVARSSSPQKEQRDTSKLPQNGQSSAKPERTHPTTDLHSPTSVLGHEARPISQKPAAQHHPTDEDVEEPDTLPIYAFYATSAVLTSGDITLAYDPESHDVDVKHDGEHVRVPGRKRVVSLGTAEVREVYYYKGSPRIYIKGSTTHVSNGQILIAFRDYEGVKWFIDTISEGTGQKIVLKHQDDPSWLDKVFKTQSRDLQQAFDRKCALYPDPALEPWTEQWAQRWLPQSDEGRQAESKDDRESQQRMSLRKNMRGRAEEEVPRSAPVSSADPHPKTVSHYFADSREGGVRRSTRQSQPIKVRTPSPSPERWTRVNKPKRWAHSLEYPSSGLRRVQVDFQDLERLDEGEFLNDNVISFALRHIEENMPAKHKESVHFFNSFFYTALTTRDGRKVSINYDAVRRWTKKKDIFSTPYIVVPINIDLHWFVAIICNLPNLSRKAAGLDESEPAEEAAQSDIDEENKADARLRDEAEAMRTLSLAENGKETVGAHAGEAGEDDEIRYEQPEEDDGKPAASGKQSTRPRKIRKRAPPMKKYDIDTPAIITLDSFGSSHIAEIRNLKEYLIDEAEEKRGMTIASSALQGVTAKGLPEQTNFCDCGLYLVGYVQEFAKDPRKFVSKVLNRQIESEADFADFNPSKKRAEIRDELLKLIELQEDERQRKKKQKAATKAPEKQDVKDDAAPQKVADTSSRTFAEEPSLVELDAAAEQPKAAVSGDTAAPAVDEPEDIESEPVRPLVHPSASTQGQAAQTDLGQTHIAHIPGVDEHEDDSEMLDGPDLRDEVLLEATGRPPPDSDKSPLSAVLRAAVEEPLTRGVQPMMRQLDGAQEHESSSSDDDDNDRDDTDDDGPDVQSIRKQASQDLGLGVRPAVIPDSQEQQIAKPTTSWRGQRTVFNS